MESPQNIGSLSPKLNLKKFGICLSVAVLVLHFPYQIESASPDKQPSQAHSRYNESYPSALSKKGLQVEMVEDALALGVKHAALNVDLCRVVAPGDASSTNRWQDGNRTYSFNSAYLDQLDQSIKVLSDAGVLVNLIILAYQSANPEINQLMIHPDYDKRAPNRLGAFNTVTKEGSEWFSASLSFLAERWSRPQQDKGRVVGYIIGNEVNSHWWWSNMGKVSMESFVQDYHRTVRLANRAVRSQSSWARVYLSLEHHWSIAYPPADPKQAFPGRPFLDRFAELAKETGDFDWHLAYHPYPESLFEPAFWEDESALPHFNTPRITFKNLDVITKYLAQEQFRINGALRRIILSEQGFHTPPGPKGEALQAAAYCYAYKKVEALPAIDAFILHRHVDHPNEGGLHLGLRDYFPDRSDRPKKQIYDCFKLADTDEWAEAFSFALPIIGIESWPSRKPSL